MCKYIFGTLAILFLGWMGFTHFYERKVHLNQNTKTCVITGASSGIGKEIAKEMVGKGWTVIGVARRANLLEELHNELGNKFIPYVCDVSDSKQVHDISEAIKNSGLKPTLFFLNAGTGYVEPPYKISSELHKNIFNTNYFGVINWVEEWITTVKSFGGGTFVATSSIASLFTTPGSAPYGASKAAVNACFESYRLLYLYENIGFSIILPGPVDTEMLKGCRKLPFKQNSAYMAKIIVDKVFEDERIIEPSKFYIIVTKLFKFLPDRLVLKILLRFKS